MVKKKKKVEKVTKREFIEHIKATHPNFTTKEAAEIFARTIDTISDSLVAGEDVLISGFGKFCVKIKSARKGRNPATGESMNLPGRRVIKFKLSSALR
jgi:integration host factor subunit alpha